MGLVYFLNFLFFLGLLLVRETGREICEPPYLTFVAPVLVLFEGVMVFQRVVLVSYLDISVSTIVNSFRWTGGRAGGSGGESREIDH